jgi:phosphoribosylformylglycinamidine synthase 2
VFKTDFGLTVDLSDYSGAQLFSETQSRYVVSVAPNQQAAFEALAQERGVFVQQLGTVTDEPTIHVTTTERTHMINKDTIESLWQHALPTLLNPS